MDAEIQDVIHQVHASPAQAVIVVTGGGAQSISRLMRVPGASRSVLEILVPYSERALTDFLGQRPQQVASADTAEAMSRQAYRRAVELAESDVPLVGIGCTAAIANRPAETWRPSSPRRSMLLRTALVTYSLEFTKGLRDRTGEDDPGRFARPPRPCGSRRYSYQLVAMTAGSHRTNCDRRLRRPFRSPRGGRARHRPCQRRWYNHSQWKAQWSTAFRLIRPPARRPPGAGDRCFRNSFNARHAGDVRSERRQAALEPTRNTRET